VERQYDPQAQHYLQPDPSAIDGTRSYVYADDDPIDFSDPTGYWPSPIDVFHRAVSAGKTLLHVAGKVAYASWNLVAGTDIHTLCCTSAHWRWAKTLAAVNIASLFFPPDALVGHGAEIAVKLGLKAGAHAGLGAVVVKLLEKVGLHVGGVDEAAIDAEIRSRAERGVEGVVRSCATCFVAGTLVATPHGERAIERLRVGDSVLSEDPTAGKVEAEAVQAVIQDPVSPLLAVELGDGSAITTTVTHAFWVDEGASKPGWLEAGRLRVGDRLREADGAEAVVAGLRRNVGRAVVYTLTVATDHTFFVGSARVLVHNATCPSIRSKITEALASANEGTRLEGQVATWIDQAGHDVIEFQRIYEKVGSSDPFTDLDIVTRNAVVEVTTGSGDARKVQQIIDRVRNAETGSGSLNPYKKRVVLYAPDLGDIIAKKVAINGGIVVKNKQDLLYVLSLLGNEH